MSNPWDPALREARKIQTAMADYGVNCVIQLRQGASSSGWLTPMSTRAGVMSHHIVSARTHGTTPFYNLVRNGRPGIPGPLANGYGGWDKVYRVITMGWANHPGAGGPITLAGRRIPRDNGRPYFWGTEYEGGLRASDWAQDDYHDWMARCNAALLDVFNLPTSAHLEHSTWTTRKVDRLGYTTATGRTRIAAVLGRTKNTTTSQKDWFTMATEADLRRVVGEALDARAGAAVHRFDLAPTTGGGVTLPAENHAARQNRMARSVHAMSSELTALHGELASLRAAVASLAANQGADPEQIIGAVREAADKGVAEALADLRITLTAAPEED
ncbi:hypothetical protein [Pseudactinotalea sp. Z1732]|uniref:hypothetical protein n=2 Tax=Micrococcales TaxID=85006 RepID=UPI003C7BF249